MFCTRCNASWLENEKSCPNCGAPSPLSLQTHTRLSLLSQYSQVLPAEASPILESERQSIPQPWQLQPTAPIEVKEVSAALSEASPSPVLGDEEQRVPESWQLQPTAPIEVKEVSAALSEPSVPLVPDDEEQRVPEPWQLQPTGPMNLADLQVQTTSAVNNASIITPVVEQSPVSEAVPAWRMNALPLPLPSVQEQSPVSKIFKAAGLETGKVTPETNTTDAQLPTQQPQFSTSLVAQERGLSLENRGFISGNASAVGLQLVPIATVEQLLPALPVETNTLHVPAMYTKRRPLTPRYRIISGLLSLIIVSLLFCGASSYYIRVSGRSSAWQPFSTSETTTGEENASVKRQIADPPDTIEKGPAFNTIPSATTASALQGYLAKQTNQIFRPGQTFYVTYTVFHPSVRGVVKVQWYMGDSLFATAISDPIDTDAIVDGYAHMVYSVPTEGRVELYWNDTLAQRLYFAVR